MFLGIIGTLFSICEIATFYYNPVLYVPDWIDYLNHQDNLTRDLFANYDPTISSVYSSSFDYEPSHNHTRTVDRWNYTILLYYLKLVEVQEPEEKVSVVLELVEQWYDPRLSWNSSLYSNIPTVFVRQEKVWSPTLSAFGVNEIIDFRDQDFRIVSIDDIGYIQDYLSVRVSSNCPMDVSRFPFDSQTCQICFCLPIFNIRQVKILNEIYEGILQEKIIKTMGNSEWKVVSLTNRVEQLKYDDDYGNMDLAVFEITIRRNPLYYIYMIVFPSFVINGISIVGIFLKSADKMSKLNVGLTNIMTMTFILGVMADKIPRTGSIPLLGIYIIINLLIMIIAITVVVLITELRQWAVPRLKLKKSYISRKLETFLGSPIEYTCAILLEFLTTANFFVIIGFWFEDL
ncbi:Neurotransmitter-gated ion-channel ligand-binding domain-containing protein [Caenorhabditis elegans]|uniref:Neurotransmitter-gated ion-channel ligand-binding domain-containing protein n=1 Tax=Caenorhabditis elegans TaxID=6239 RepID=Q22085_CAEEL|nr:Neurotransmitter-gated ion-channel ligand-binding domain-containing protein [Caenorhabditis elegans]CAA91541.2 Neurotransmitter-gated ion-channel ligand-binding domain-containing protein [Caenorhabditis elegans]|eukprot:NP_510028.2 Ligand-Gated ion Channel [Caenorhabditis elegans]